MNIREQILDEFNSTIDQVKDEFIEKLRKILEESHKKKPEALSDKSSEEEKCSPPHKRPSPTQVSNPRKLKKKQETKPKAQEPSFESQLPKENAKGYANENNKPSRISENIEKPEKLAVISDPPLDSAIIPLRSNTEIPRSAEGIKNSIKELNDCTKDRANFIVDSLTSLFTSESNLKILDILVEIKAGQRFKRLIREVQSQELKTKYTKLLEIIKNLAKPMYVSASSTNWSHLHKQIVDAHSRKSDTELNVGFKKISEGLAEKIDENSRTFLEKIMEIVSGISKEWRNQDIKQRASIINTKYKEKFPNSKLATESQGSHIADRFTSIIPGLNSIKK